MLKLQCICYDPGHYLGPKKLITSCGDVYKPPGASTNESEVTKSKCDLDDTGNGNLCLKGHGHGNGSIMSSW